MMDLLLKEPSIQILQNLSHNHCIGLLQVNKMMNYITERFVDLRQPRSKRRNLSNLQIKHQAEIGQYQDPQSFKQAVTTFIKNEEHSEHLLKRLSVLREQDRKLEGRAALNDSKLQNYRSIREKISHSRKQSQLYRLELAKEMQMTRSILAHEREAQAFALQQARRKMYFDKWSNYLDQRQNQKTEMNTTKLSLETQIVKKRQKNIEMRLIQQEQKKNVNQFYERKKSAIKFNIQQDNIRMNSMNESKMDELQTLSHMESVLLLRQARSRMNSEESIAILNNIITYNKGSKSPKRSNSCLPTNDIYVI